MDIPRAAEEGYSSEEAEEMFDAGKRSDQVYCCNIKAFVLGCNGTTAKLSIVCRSTADCDSSNSSSCCCNCCHDSYTTFDMAGRQKHASDISKKHLVWQCTLLDVLLL